MSSTAIRNGDIRRFVKYCLVGVINTLVTLGVIFVCKSVFGWNLYLSNALGYVAGVVNSFLWNRAWVFRSHGRCRREALRFAAGFGACYGAQLLAVWVMTQSPLGRMEFDLGWFVLSGYGVATLIGNVLYTLLNFLYNKLVTFRD